ncbi:MAG: hypothetical protein HY543_09730 [Deltaproteobacteria bacterium]|nr:hypothetical protein [Deltaproteobacteria bacterium]
MARYGTDMFRRGISLCACLLLLSPLACRKPSASSPAVSDPAAAVLPHAGATPAAQAGSPAPAQAPDAPLPEIAGVKLAIDINPRTMKLKGSGAVFSARLLNQRKKLKVAVLLKGLLGGETLTLTLVNPEGGESAPIVKQYAKEERGEFFATAFFEAGKWRTGPHQVKVNLNDQSFAIHEFMVIP